MGQKASLVHKKPMFCDTVFPHCANVISIRIVSLMSNSCWGFREMRHSGSQQLTRVAHRMMRFIAFASEMMFSHSIELGPSRRICRWNSFVNQFIGLCLDFNIGDGIYKVNSDRMGRVSHSGFIKTFQKWLEDLCQLCSPFLRCPPSSELQFPKFRELICIISECSFELRYSCLQVVIYAVALLPAGSWLLFRRGGCHIVPIQPLAPGILLCK